MNFISYYLWKAQHCLDARIARTILLFSILLSPMAALPVSVSVGVGDLTPFESACNSGDAKSCYDLANSIVNFQNDIPANSQALTLFKRSCDLSFALACHSLAVMYSKGLGSPVSNETAVVYLNKACNAGKIRESCTLLGNLVKEGRGTQRDLAKAEALFDWSCRAGDRQACSLLAEFQAKRNKPSSEQTAANAPRLQANAQRQSVDNQRNAIILDNTGKVEAAFLLLFRTRASLRYVAGSAQIIKEYQGEYGQPIYSGKYKYGLSGDTTNEEEEFIAETKDGKVVCMKLYRGYYVPRACEEVPENGQIADAQRAETKTNNDLRASGKIIPDVANNPIAGAPGCLAQQTGQISYSNRGEYGCLRADPFGRCSERGFAELRDTVILTYSLQNNCAKKAKVAKKCSNELRQTVELDPGENIGLELNCRAIWVGFPQR